MKVEDYCRYRVNSKARLAYITAEAEKTFGRVRLVRGLKGELALVIGDNVIQNVTIYRPLGDRYLMFSEGANKCILDCNDCNVYVYHTMDDILNVILNDISDDRDESLYNPIDFAYGGVIYTLQGKYNGKAYSAAIYGAGPYFGNSFVINGSKMVRMTMGRFFNSCTRELVLKCEDWKLSGNVICCTGANMIIQDRQHRLVALNTNELSINRVTDNTADVVSLSRFICWDILTYSCNNKITRKWLKRHNRRKLK